MARFRQAGDRFEDGAIVHWRNYGADLHAKRIDLSGRRDARHDDIRLAGGVVDRPGAGAGAGLENQARGQAGGPADKQRWHQRLGQFYPLGAVTDRQAPEHPGCDGLGRFRPRRPGDPGAEPGHRTRPAAPLLWLTVWKEELKNQRNDYEDGCLRRLSELVPAGCRVTILADRGFGDQKLFVFLGELGFDYVIRFRGNIHVTDADGRTRPAAEWVGKVAVPANCVTPGSRPRASKSARSCASMPRA